MSNDYFNSFEEKARPIPSLKPVASKEQRRSQSDYMTVSSNSPVAAEEEQETTPQGEFKSQNLAWSKPDALALNSMALIEAELKDVVAGAPKDVLIQPYYSIGGAEPQAFGNPIETTAVNNIVQEEIYLGTPQELYDAQQDDPEAQAEFSFSLEAIYQKAVTWSNGWFLPLRQPVDVLEMEDTLFRSNSAFFLPSSTVAPKAATGLMHLEKAFLFLHSNPGKKVFISGHADTSGDIAYNRKISLFRSQAVYSLLYSDADLWMSIFGSQKKDGVQTYRPEDIQHILTFLSASTPTGERAFSWDTDPHGIDGDLGANTSKAVRKFQSLYNDMFSESISVDGQWGKQCFKALFDILQELLYEGVFLSGEKDIDEIRGNIEWLFPDGNPYSACGETFPIDKKNRDNYRSEKNRRVEIFFFPEEAKFELPCHNAPCDESACLQKECPIYGKDLWQKNYLDPNVAKSRSYALLLQLDATTVLKNTKFEVHNGSEKISSGTSDNAGIIHITTKTDHKNLTLSLQGHVFPLAYLEEFDWEQGETAIAEMNNLDLLSGHVDKGFTADNHALQDLRYFENQRNLSLSKSKANSESLEQLDAYSSDF